MTKPNLLAYKPVLFDARDGSLVLASTPEYKLQYRKYFITTCSYGHVDEQIPHERCVCGLYTTLDLEEVERFIKADYHKPTKQAPYVPAMGVFQVLGKTVVEDLTLRSHGAYLWGLVKPAEMPQIKWEKLVRMVEQARNRPIFYDNITEANYTVCSTWKHWDLD